MNTQSAIKILSRMLDSHYLYCDVGARWGVNKTWGELSESVGTICFEPDPEEFKRLSPKICKKDILLPDAVGGEVGSATLYLTRSRGASSLYKPNFSFLNNFPDVQRFTIEKEIPVQVTTFDRLNTENKISHIDFMKLDIQGAELGALKGGCHIVSRSCIGLESEAEYVQMYEGQPLFQDLHDYVTRELGFQLYSLKNYYWKTKDTLKFSGTNGQLIYADTLYLRSPQNYKAWLDKFHQGSERSMVIKGVMTGIIYGYLDYGHSLISHPELQVFLPEEDKKIIERILQGLNPKAIVRSYKISRLLYFLYKKTQSFHQGWASADPALGQTFSSKGIKAILD